MTMTRSKLTCRWLTLLACSMTSVMAADRVWNSTDGESLDGTMMKADEKTVTIRRSSGQSVTIPLDRLSKPDRRYARAKQREAAALAMDVTKEDFLSGPLTYQLSAGNESWPDDRKKRIVDAMMGAIKIYNANGKFRKNETANNSPGTPTADANYAGWINFGNSISVRVAMHEIAHTLGVGTHENWQKNIKDGKWTGKHALAQLAEFDGPGAVLHCDRQHFWPYGYNQDNEASPVNDVRHVKMVEAIRKDLGISDER
jgi:hypothetical protein